MSAGTRSPLWEVMQRAFLDGRSPGLSDRFGYAAEIRAIRDFIEEIAVLHCWHPGQVGRITELLTAEAERSERNNTHTPEGKP